MERSDASIKMDREKEGVITQEFRTRLEGTRTPEEVIELHSELYERLVREAMTPTSDSLRAEMDFNALKFARLRELREQNS